MVPFAVNLGDGIGVEHNSELKSSEDFLTLNGKIFKLDQTLSSFSEKNLTSHYTFLTKPDSKQYPDAHCDLTFDPSGKITESFYFIVGGLY